MNSLCHTDILRVVAERLDTVDVARLFATFSTPMRRALLSPGVVTSVHLKPREQSSPIGYVHYLLLNVTHVTSLRVDSIDHITENCLLNIRRNPITSVTADPYQLLSISMTMLRRGTFEGQIFEERKKLWHNGLLNLGNLFPTSQSSVFRPTSRSWTAKIWRAP